MSRSTWNLWVIVIFLPGGFEVMTIILPAICLIKITRKLRAMKWNEMRWGLIQISGDVLGGKNDTTIEWGQQLVSCFAQVLLLQLTTRYSIPVWNNVQFISSWQRYKITYWTLDHLLLKKRLSFTWDLLIPCHTCPDRKRSCSNKIVEKFTIFVTAVC